MYVNGLNACSSLDNLCDRLITSYKSYSDKIPNLALNGNGSHWSTTCDVIVYN